MSTNNKHFFQVTQFENIIFFLIMINTLIKKLLTVKNRKVKSQSKY